LDTKTDGERFTYRHPRPALTVDCAVLGADLERGRLEVLLVRRKLEPHAGRWALPGGFVDVGEDLEAAARRELEEETGLERIFLEQLYTFGAPDRDPRERVVSVAYFALVKPGDHRVRAASDAADAAWFAVPEAPELAFDHARILAMALERLKGKVRYQPIGFELLPPRFTLTQLQRLYEIVLETPLDKRNFRKRILAMELLEELDEVEQDVAHRAARFYRFDGRRYRQLQRRGFHFEM